MCQGALLQRTKGWIHHNVGSDRLTTMLKVQRAPAVSLHAPAQLHTVLTPADSDAAFCPPVLAASVWKDPSALAAAIIEVSLSQHTATTAQEVTLSSITTLSTVLAPFPQLSAQAGYQPVCMCLERPLLPRVPKGPHTILQLLISACTLVRMPTMT